MAVARVDGRARLTNGYFFIEGMRQAFGSVTWVTGGLPGVPEAEHFRRFVVCQLTDPALRLVFDYGDSPELDQNLMDWAHAYGKVNCTAEQRDAGVVPIGPPFGIRPGRRAAMGLAVRGLIPTAGDVGWRSTVAERRNFLLRTPQLADFVPDVVDPAYLFYLASLWEYASCLDVANPLRAAWMRTARQTPGVTFEGGFLPYPSSPEGPPVGLQVEEFADLIWNKRMPIGDWISKTQASFAVFNTPAVQDCLGWKLGQFLALGKAIVTLPLTREMPEPLSHGREVHVIETVEEIPATIALLRSQPDYRELLQTGARRYWDQHLGPVNTVRRVAQAASRTAATRRTTDPT